MTYYGRAIDTLLALADGVAQTTDGYTDVGGSDATIDLGSLAPKVSSGQGARMACMVMLEVTALAFNDGNETYGIYVVGSNSATFASGNEILGALFLGDQATPVGGITGLADNSATGRYYIPFINERGGTNYRYIRLYVDVGGTTPSITQRAYLVEAAEMAAR